MKTSKPISGEALRAYTIGHMEQWRYDDAKHTKKGLFLEKTRMERIVLSLEL